MDKLHENKEKERELTQKEKYEQQAVTFTASFIRLNTVTLLTAQNLLKET